MNDSINFPEIISLPTEATNKFIGQAFDGNWFYLLPSATCEICKYDKNFKLVEVFSVSRKYSCICYDVKSNCFWSAAQAFPNVVFQLDICFNEIRKICLPIKPGQGGEINGISYNCKKHTLVLSFAKAVCEFEPCRDKLKIVYLASKEKIDGVLSVYPFLIVTTSMNGAQTIVAMNDCGEVVGKLPVMCDATTQQILYFPCTDKPMFMYLTTVNNDCSKIFVSPVPSEFVCKIDKCNDTICMSCPPPPCPHTPCCDDPWASDPCCDESCCCEKKSCHCCECASAMVMESVAYVETAIAHILNAEGEKLQKVIAMSNCIEEILAVNREVNKTILNVIQLEQVLYQKLVAVNEAKCCRHQKCCDDECC